MKAPLLEQLPSVGFIEEATAAGFLLQAECSIGFLEHYISNPTASKEEREKALHEITKRLLAKAKAIGIKVIMFNTKFPSIKRLAEQCEFNYLGEYSSFFGEV